jgi:hypothetical protein
MRELLRDHRPAALLLVLTLTVLSVGVGFCLFDGHAHHASHAVSFDLCLGVALVAVAAVGFISVLLHPLSLDPLYAIHAISLHTPDPPPKSYALV